MVGIDVPKARHQLGKWQALGHEKKSFVSSQGELFTNPAAGDYSTKKSSPAIGRGMPPEREGAVTSTADIGCDLASSDVLR